MKKDAALEEIWEVRRKISEQHGHDTQALIAHYKQMENRFKDRILHGRQASTISKKETSETVLETSD